MKSDLPLATHFMLTPPTYFKVSGPNSIVFDPKHPGQYLTDDYVGKPFHRVFWRAQHIVTEHPDFDEILRLLVESAEPAIPLAYLLVQQRLMTPGNVLELVFRSRAVLGCALTKRSLNTMLDGWEMNLRNEHWEPKPLVAGRPVDVGGAGSDIYIDTDPITEELVSPLLYSSMSRIGLTTVAFRAMIREFSVALPGEVHAAGLARTGRVGPRDCWRFGGYTRGTLRQVFASVLSTKTVLGPYPPDAVGPGLHTNDDWAC